MKNFFQETAKIIESKYHMMFEIQVLSWDRQKNVTGLNQFKESHLF